MNVLKVLVYLISLFFKKRKLTWIAIHQNPISNLTITNGSLQFSYTRNYHVGHTYWAISGFSTWIWYYNELTRGGAAPGFKHFRPFQQFHEDSQIIKEITRYFKLTTWTEAMSYNTDGQLLWRYGEVDIFICRQCCFRYYKIIFLH